MTILDITGNSNSSADAAANGNRPPVAQRWPALRAASTGEAIVNRAASGAMAQDQAFAGMGAVRSADTNAMVICDMNDARFVYSSRIDRFKEILSRIIGDIVLPTRKTLRSAGVTKTGAWTNTQVDPIGMYATAPGAKVSASVNGTAVYVGFFVDNHTASHGATADVYIDGAYKGTISSDNIGVNTTGNTYNGLRYGPALARFVVPAGAHTVEAVVTSSGKNIYISYLTGNADQPDTARVLVGNCYRLNATGIASFGVTETTSALFRDAIADVVNQFTADGFDAHIIDTYNAIDPNAHLMPDGLHWNANGHIAVKNAIAAIGALGYSQTYPMANGHVLTVNFNAGNVVTSYAEN